MSSSRLERPPRASRLVTPTAGRSASAGHVEPNNKTAKSNLPAKTDHQGPPAGVSLLQKPSHHGQANGYGTQSLGRDQHHQQQQQQQLAEGQTTPERASAKLQSTVPSTYVTLEYAGQPRSASNGRAQIPRHPSAVSASPTAAAAVGAVTPATGSTEDAQRSLLNAHIQTYTNWANHYLQKSRQQPLITNIQSDLSDGVFLARLIEAVVGEKLCDVAKNAAVPLASIEACFSFLTARGVSVENIRPKDIQSGSLRAILGLLYNLSHYKQQCKQTALSSAGGRSSRPAPPSAAAGSMPARLPSPFSGRAKPSDNTTDMSMNGDDVTINHAQFTNNNNISADCKVIQPPSLLPRSSSLQPAESPVLSSRIPSAPGSRKLSDAAATLSSLTGEQIAPHQQPPSGSKLRMSSARQRTSKDSSSSADSSRPPNGQTTTTPSATLSEAYVTSTFEQLKTCNSPAVASRLPSGLPTTPVSTPTKSQRIPSRSLPRSQVASGARSSGRRSVEPGGNRLDDQDQAAQTMTMPAHYTNTSPQSGIASNCSSGSASSVADSHASTGTTSRKSTRLGLPVPQAGGKSKPGSGKVTSRPATPSGGANSSMPSTAVAKASTKDAKKSSGISKPRSSSATGVQSTPGGLVAEHGDHVSTKSSVATVRQLSVNAPPEQTTPSKARSTGIGSSSRMPRYSTSSAPHGTTAPRPSTATDAGSPSAAITLTVDSPDDDVTETLDDNVSSMSTSLTPTLTSSTDGGPTDMMTPKSPPSPMDVGGDAMDIKPMEPIASLSYLGSSSFVSTPGDGSTGSLRRTLAADPSQLLSASRRPFIPLTRRTAGLYGTASGYVSDGDVLPGGTYRSDDQRHSGYVSEGGSSLYTRRGQNRFQNSIDSMRRYQLDRAMADEDDDSFDENDYSSVTSADIDNTISDDDDEQLAADRLLDVALNNNTNNQRHVAFASRPGSRDDLSNCIDGLSINRSNFERGSTTRATLPAFTSSELIGGLFMRRPGQQGDMRAQQQTSSSADRSRLQTPTSPDQRQRSKSAGRAMKKDSSTNTDRSAVSKSPAGVQQGAAPATKHGKNSGGRQTSKTPNVDEEAKGERLSNYSFGSLLRSGGGSTTQTGPLSRGGIPLVSPSELTTVDQRYPVSGRRSVDSTSSVSSQVIRNGGQEELLCPTPRSGFGVGAGSGGMSARRNCMTPVNGGPCQIPFTDPSGGIRPRLQSSSGRLSDVEGTSYMGTSPAVLAAGRRSLPRNGSSWTYGGPASYYSDQDVVRSAAVVGLNSLGAPVMSSPYSVASTGLTSKMSTSTENMLHGSSLSLGSNSSHYSTAEEMQANEIYKLRRELEAAQTKILTLSSQLNTNAHVVFAFEQSLINMTHRLQRLAATTDQKDAELNDMRSVIDSLRAQSGGLNIVMDITDTSSGNTESPPPHAMRRHMSSDSVISGSSHQSFLMSQAEIERKKKKSKNWLSSFGKAFSRKKKTGSMSDAESDTSSVYADARLSAGGNNEAAVVALQEQLHEKDLRLTDVQLEALSSAHQLQQMHDTINRMQNEMFTLRVDNERLNRLVAQKGVLSSPSTASTDTERSNSPAGSHQFQQRSNMANNAQTGDSPSKVRGNSQQMTLSVQVISAKKETAVQIGKISLDRNVDWDVLIETVSCQFKEYLSQLDPGTSLDLSEDSIQSISLGDVTVGRDTSKPAVSPRDCLAEDKSTVSLSISLKGAEHKSVDTLAFDTLVPKSIVQRYVSLLTEHRRMILCGSSGTGKSYLARRLAEHLILRSGKPLDADAIATFIVDTKSGRELRPYLSSVAEKCEQKSTELPQVIILDGLHHVATSLADAFNGFLSIDYQSSPYIIGVMNQASGSTTNLQLHHNFRWVLCANHMEPVQGFLGRYLRRRLLAAMISSSSELEDMERIVEWVPQVWQHLNRLLEAHNCTDVTIGPRLFLSCPMNMTDVKVWFTDLWNYSIVPYLLEAIREGIQSYGNRAAWEDPSDWILSTCPWAEHNGFDWSALQRIRPEDIGCDSVTINSSTNASRNAQSRTNAADNSDPLMNMLLQLQESTNCSNAQTITG